MVLALPVLNTAKTLPIQPNLPTLARKKLIHAWGVSSRWQKRASRSRLKRIRFAHPAEADFARILNFYRVRWLYEPHQFPLDWYPDGSVARMFSPDFYLPDFDLYAELTTQKQSLVTRKNAKLRRLRELYPDINVKLFYRKDLQRFLARFGLKVQSQTLTPPGGLRS